MANLSKATGAAMDFIETGGQPMRQIRTNKLVMALLDTIVCNRPCCIEADEKSTLGDHVRCCMDELHKFDEALKECNGNA